MVTRFPHTVVCLRSQWEDLSSREARDWLDRSAEFIRDGQVDILRPHINSMQTYLWLFVDDPR